MGLSAALPACCVLFYARYLHLSYSSVYLAFSLCIYCMLVFSGVLVRLSCIVFVSCFVSCYAGGLVSVLMRCFVFPVAFNVCRVHRGRSAFFHADYMGSSLYLSFLLFFLLFCPIIGAKIVR